MCPSGACCPSPTRSPTLSDRGVIIAGNPASCIKTYQMYEDIGVDQVMLIMQTEPIPHDKGMGSIEKACGSRSCSP